MLGIGVDVSVTVKGAVVRLRPIAVWIVTAPNRNLPQLDHLGVPDVLTEDRTDLGRLVVITQNVKDVATPYSRSVSARLLEAEITEDYESVLTFNHTINPVQDHGVMLFDRGVLGPGLASEIFATKMKVCGEKGLHSSPNISVRLSQ